MLKFAIEIIRWIYWYPFRYLVQKLPLGLGYKVADFFIPLMYLISVKNRKMINNGLSIMYKGNVTPQMIRKISLNTFRNILYSAIEVLWYPKLTEEMCREVFTIEGLQNLDGAIKKGKGAILLHGHFGNAHLIMPAIGYRGYKLSQLASRIPPGKNNGFMSRFVNNISQKAYEIKLGYKEKLPVNFIYTDGPIRDVFRRLKNNELVAIGIDGREGTRWVPIDFLGRKAFFYTGAMRIILKARPEVLPVFHVRNPNGKHSIIIEKPIKLELTGDEKTDITVNTAIIFKILESYIYKYPDHYARIFCVDDKFFFKNGMDDT